MLIGKKIKNLRLKNGLTQAELANRCDLSKSFISQLEADLTSPSLATLEDILVCLGSSFNLFFGDPKSDKPVYTKNDCVTKEFSGGQYLIEWLVSDAQNNDMEPIILTINPQAKTSVDEPHGGEEFGYILSGTITLWLGDSSYKVKKGESFCFEPTLPHFIENKSKSVARVLWVSTPPSF